MSTNTTNYNLEKQAPEEFYDVQVVNSNLDKIDTAIKEAKDAAENVDLSQIEQSIEDLQNEVTSHKDNYVDHVGYAVDSGTANAKVVTLSPVPTSYVDGMAIAFKNAVQNTGATTININGLGAKAIVKSNGNALASGNLKAGSIYTLRYNSTTGNFILQGEGGEYGTAEAAQVLSGYTVGRETGVVSGTIPNKVGSGTVITPSGSDQIIPKGYYDGSLSSGKVLPIQLTAGENKLIEDTLEEYTQSTTLTLMKEITVTNGSGALRVKFDFYSPMGEEATARLYINGIAVANEFKHPTSVSYFVTITTDVSISSGDKIQVYLKASQSYHTAYLKNFGLYCGNPPFNGIISK